MLTKTTQGFEVSIKSPTAFGACSSAVAGVKPRGGTPLYGVHVASRRWLSFLRLGHMYAMNFSRFTGRSKFVRFHAILFLIVWAVVPPASAQPRPILGVGFSAGQPTLSLRGVLGTVYSIQYATGIFPTNLWVDRTLLQATGASNVWSDPSAATPGQRFYRAVSVPT